MVATLLVRGLREIRMLEAKLKLTEISGGFDVFDGIDHLHILNKSRAGRYRYGISRFLRRLARDYGVPKFVSVRRGDTVLDLGANIGEFSLYAAGRGAKVFAIEPDPTIGALLRHNVESKGVTVLPYAVWNKDEPVSFNLAADNADSSIVNAAANAVSVRGYRMDTLVRELGLERIRLIKGDAEGGEPEVLEGAREALAKTEYISLDCGFERSGERTLEACAEILKSYGFEIVRYQEIGRCNLIGRNPKLAG